MSPGGGRGSLLWGSHTAVTLGSQGAGTGWRKATEGKGTDWMWVTDESDRELGTPAWSLKLEGILQRGRGEGDTSSLEEPGTLGGLRDCSGVEEDLGRRCRMEEKKEQDSGRGMVPIPLSNVRIVQPEHIIFGHFWSSLLSANYDGILGGAGHCGSILTIRSSVQYRHLWLPADVCLSL